jgi:hypothetical protein
MAEARMKPVRSISWEIGVESTAGAEPLILRRDVMKEQMDEAATVCISALKKHFALSAEAVDGLSASMDNTHSWVTFGQEGNNVAESGVYPVGVLSSNVIDLHTRRTIVAEAVKPPEVRVSVEGVAEEATNLKQTALQIVNDRKQGNISQSTREVVNELLEDEQYLINTASRIASARRLVRYVILPNGSLRGVDMNIGFDTWFSEQFGRRGGQKPSKAVLKEIKLNYADNEMALKNVRRSAWVPIFFTVLGIDFGDLGFYLEYRQQLSRNNGYTVTFSSPLTILLEHPETAHALERVFNASAPNLEVVKC